MTFRTKARRAGWLLVVAVFAFGIVSAIRPASASAAYGLISTRYIKMSSSDASGVSGSGLGTNVIYSVGYTVATTATVGSMVIRFCALTPIIGDACTRPTNFDANPATLSINNQTGLGTGLSQFTLQSGVSDQYELLFTRTSGTLNSGTSVSFDLGNGSTNGITNPSVLGTYYARIMLFSSTATSPLPAATSDANASNAGGVALSTANVLNVTAKVQEQLTFCVHTGTLCSDGGNAVLLGDSNNVLAATNQAYLDSSPKFDIASNALSGVIVRLKGDTLTSGTFTISPNGNTCVADSTATTTEQFGVRMVSYGSGMYNGDATAGGGTNGTPFGGTNDFSCNAGSHKFDPTQTNTTYGQNFVRTVGATDLSTSNFEIAAKASSTTEAGVYTTKLSLIATATY